MSVLHVVYKISAFGELNYTGAKDSYSSLIVFKLFESNYYGLHVFLSNFYPIMFICFFNWPSDERAFCIAFLKLPSLFPKTTEVSYNILYNKPKPFWLFVLWPNTLS